MFDLTNTLRFLTKETTKISIEEFLFLNVVRIASVEDAKPNSAVLDYINLYYSQNRFYGRDLYPKEYLKYMDWNLMIDKLVKQGFLLDYRKNKNTFSVKDLEVTEEFKNLIWKDDKREVWNDFYELVVELCGPTFFVQDKQISYFSLSATDKMSKIKNASDLVDYFWVNICKNGNRFEIEKFFHHVEFYIRKKGALNMKIVTFLENYHENMLKKEIEQAIEKEYE